MCASDGSLPCDQKSSCSVMTRWRWPYARSPGTWQDAKTGGGSGACPSGSSMRTCHSGQRSQGAREQSPGESPGSASRNAQWAMSWMEQVSGLPDGSFASPGFCLSGYKSPDFQGMETGYSIYTWKVTSGAALARTEDDEKWTDVHGQVGGTIRGTDQCCGPHASAGGSACLTLISLSVFSKKKKPLN